MEEPCHSQIIVGRKINNRKKLAFKLSFRLTCLTIRSNLYFDVGPPPPRESPSNPGNVAFDRGYHFDVTTSMYF